MSAKPIPLANCIILVRMWQDHAEGAEKLVMDSIGMRLDDFWMRFVQIYV